MDDDDEDDFFEVFRYPPPPPQIQHARLVALRTLNSSGIPCILWGDDALVFAHSVYIGLGAQEVLVPDHQLNDAVSVLNQIKYNRVPMCSPLLEAMGRHDGISIFPKGIYLQHADIPENNPYKLDPVPCFILLLPQSYFGLDIRSSKRFQSLVPPLDSSNAGILVPKYHTFLEACVHAVMNPPVGFFLRGSKLFHDFMIYSLFTSRMLTHVRGVPFSELSPAGTQIISELETDDAAWYIHYRLWSKNMVRQSKVEEYKELKNVPKLTSSGSSMAPGPIKSSLPRMQSSLMPKPHGVTRPYSTVPPSREQVIQLKTFSTLGVFPSSLSFNNRSVKWSFMIFRALTGRFIR